MFKSYRDTKQFSNIIRAIRTAYDYKGKDADGNSIYIHDSPYPIIPFIGTVKIHGTNGAICFTDRQTCIVQSRSRIITPESDNMGFAMFVEYLPNEVKEILFDLFGSNSYIYGEFAGSNIQKGVGVAQLPKSFYIFSARENLPVDRLCSVVGIKKGLSTEELDLLNKHNIYFIDQFKTFEINIDFNQPDIASNIIAQWVQEVEKECPIAKQFGISGIGEGIVFTGIFQDCELAFKCKGKKHSTSKVQTLAAVDIEKVNSVNEFVEKVVTQNRLNQGLDYLREMTIPIDMKSTGAYLKWVMSDISKEETEVLEESGLTMKDVASKCQAVIKAFWYKTVNTI